MHALPVVPGGLSIHSNLPILPRELDMAQRATQNGDYFGSPDGSPNGREKEKHHSDNDAHSSAPAYTDATYNNGEGEVIDPYGGKKLGMVRVSAAGRVREITANIR